MEWIDGWKWWGMWCKMKELVCGVCEQLKFGSNLLKMLNELVFIPLRDLIEDFLNFSDLAPTRLVYCNTARVMSGFLSQYSLKMAHESCADARPKGGRVGCFDVVTRLLLTGPCSVYRPCATTRLVYPTRPAVFMLPYFFFLILFPVSVFAPFSPVLHMIKFIHTHFHENI